MAKQGSYDGSANGSGLKESVSSVQTFDYKNSQSESIVEPKVNNFTIDENLQH